MTSIDIARATIIFGCFFAGGIISVIANSLICIKFRTVNIGVFIAITIPVCLVGLYVGLKIDSEHLQKEVFTPESYNIEQMRQDYNARTVNDGKQRLEHVTYFDKEDWIYYSPEQEQRDSDEYARYKIVEKTDVSDVGDKEDQEDKT